MTIEQFSNFGNTTLSSAFTAGGTTLVVASVANFPVSFPFRLVVENEIFWVTGATGNTLDVTPGYEGTTSVNHATGVAVTHTMTAGALQTIQAASSNAPAITEVTSGASFNAAATSALSVYVVKKGTGSATTGMLPASPSANQIVVIVDGKRDANTNNITVNGNGNPLSANGGSASTYVIGEAGGKSWWGWDSAQWVLLAS